MQEPIWKHQDFPNYYYNEGAVVDLQEEFRESFERLADLYRGRAGKAVDAEILTEETVKNSEVEGVALERDSVRSSFLNNLRLEGSREGGALEVTRMALEGGDTPLTSQQIKQMHRTLFEGSMMDVAQRGAYVGNMRIVSGGRLDREPLVEDFGVPKEGVDGAMDAFVSAFNQAPERVDLAVALRLHLHFEAVHPFADGNGRIGRALMQRCLNRGREAAVPLALSRAILQNRSVYYGQFRSGLDFTEVIKTMGPVMIEAVVETVAIIELTVLRGKGREALNSRQGKVLDRLVDYELRGEMFRGGVSNANYRKMTGANERMAQRDLAGLVDTGLLLRKGRLSGTRYFLNLSKNEG